MWWAIDGYRYRYLSFWCLSLIFGISWLMGTAVAWQWQWLWLWRWRQIDWILAVWVGFYFEFGPPISISNSNSYFSFTIIFFYLPHYLINLFTYMEAKGNNKTEEVQKSWGKTCCTKFQVQTIIFQFPLLFLFPPSPPYQTSKHCPLLFFSH